MDEPDLDLIDYKDELIGLHDRLALLSRTVSQCPTDVQEVARAVAEEWHSSGRGGGAMAPAMMGALRAVCGQVSGEIGSIARRLHDLASAMGE